MTRLKSRAHRTPGGFQVLIPEGGMEKPFVGSFIACCDFVRDFRKKNKHLCVRYNWTPDDKEIEDYVDSRESARCVAHGWTEYVVTDAAAPPLEYTWRPQKKTTAADVGRAGESDNTFGGHVRKIKAGIGLVSDWLGAGLEPVSQETGNRRAWSCAVRANGKGCVKNSKSIALKEQRAADGLQGDPRDFVQRMASGVASAVKALSEVMNDLKLSTPHDAQLGTCLVCDCDLKTKMWPSLDHVLENTSEIVMAALDSECWIKNETRT